jgi:hypothetical protein
MKYVVRTTSHPEEDLKRNWSAIPGGVPNSDLCIYDSIEKTEDSWNLYYGINSEYYSYTNCFKSEEWDFHPAYGGYIKRSFYGLGAIELRAGNLQEAQLEVLEEYYNKQYELLNIDGPGSGHFYADICNGFYETDVKDLWIFEILD